MIRAISSGLIFILGLFIFNAAAQSITWLGTLGGIESMAYDVSSDGSVVVGQARDSSNFFRAFRWTASGGMQDLGTLGGAQSNAYGVSADGSVVVGRANNAANQWKAFRWTAQSGMQELGTLPTGIHSFAYDVSADGDQVVGQSDTTWLVHAFHWDPLSGMKSLGTLSGSSNSVALATSADGSVIVGWGDNGQQVTRAFRWTASDGMQDIGTFPGGSGSIANGISDDGTFIVGSANNANDITHAFRWSQSGGMQDLGSLGTTSEAFDATADGSIVVGSYMTGFGQALAFRWTEANGMEDLNVLYDSLVGITAKMRYARAISPDGRFIVGWGNRAGYQGPVAFILDTGTSTNIRHNSSSSLADQPELFTNYPNPFNPETTIEFALPKASTVILQIWDIRGHKIRTLLNGKLPAGTHKITWDGKNEYGQPVSTGVYVYRLFSHNFNLAKKMLLLR